MSKSKNKTKIINRRKRKQERNQMIREICEKLGIEFNSTYISPRILLALEKAAEIIPPEIGQPFSSPSGRLNRVVAILTEKFGLSWEVIRLEKKPKRPRLKTLSQRAAEFYESFEWRQARYRILVKYGRVCMACGENQGVMHVDHIKPLKKNWDLRLDPDNLQVLCPVCNHGKGNSDETDFRPKPARVIRIVRD